MTLKVTIKDDSTPCVRFQDVEQGECFFFATHDRAPNNNDLYIMGANRYIEGRTYSFCTSLGPNVPGHVLMWDDITSTWLRSVMVILADVEVVASRKEVVE